jgi:DNA-binding GntR family transcriptional regulator
VTKNKPLLEQAYISIRELIINGEIAPGEKLVESRLAEKLGISRTPIREALRRLELEGLVTYVPLQGAQAAHLDRSSIINLYKCRAALEAVAAGEAALRINDDMLQKIEESIMLAEQFYSKGDHQRTVEKNTQFHDVILASSGNNILIQLMEQIKTQILRFRSITSEYGFRPTFIQEHQEIYDSLRQRDSEESERLMREHVKRDLETILERLERNNIL